MRFPGKSADASVREGLVIECASTKDTKEGQMSESLVILDPTDERVPLGRRPAARPDQLHGTLGIIDIAKPRGDVFLDEIERLLSTRFPSLDIIRLRKPTYTKPAPSDLRNEVETRCQAVIQALAD